MKQKSLRNMDVSKFNGRDWIVLILSLLLAFSIWFIHNLSLNYTEFLQVPVVAKTDLEGYAQESENKADIIARCRTSGFNILRNRIFKNSKPKVLVFDPNNIKKFQGNTFYITANELTEYAHLIYGDIVSLEYFVNDTIFFNFGQEAYKKVPVIPITNITYREQYGPVDKIRIDPDSVVVYGSPRNLKKVTKINTEIIKFNELDEQKNGVVGLVKNKAFRYGSDEFKYSIDVARTVEIPIEVSIYAKNVPRNKELIIFPSSARVVLNCKFPLHTDNFSNLVFYVDYNDYKNSKDGTCVLKIDNLAEGVVSYDSDPQIFECIINNLSKIQ